MQFKMPQDTKINNKKCSHKKGWLWETEAPSNTVYHGGWRKLLSNVNLCQKLNVQNSYQSSRRGLDGQFFCSGLDFASVRKLIRSNAGCKQHAGS